MMYAYGDFTDLTRTSLHPDLRSFCTGHTRWHAFISIEEIEPRLISRLINSICEDGKRLTLLRTSSQLATIRDRE
jgi:hypothetical protein